LVNAKEGNGQRGAGSVVITTRLRRGAVDIDFKDDGPGFAPALLEKLGRNRGYTTKRGSSGIGPWLSQSSLLAAGGSLKLMSEDNGARVRVTLRAAP
jgi:signal transduction histidine kinase